MSTTNFGAFITGCACGILGCILWDSYQEERKEKLLERFKEARDKSIKHSFEYDCECKKECEKNEPVFKGKDSFGETRSAFDEFLKDVKESKGSPMANVPDFNLQPRVKKDPEGDVKI